MNGEALAPLPALRSERARAPPELAAALALPVVVKVEPPQAASAPEGPVRGAPASWVEEQATAHLVNSRSLFLHLVDKVRSADKKLEQQFIEARDYEALEAYTLRHLMGVSDGAAR